MEETTGEPTPQHLHFRAGLNAHGMKTLAQGGMAGKGEDAQPLAFSRGTEGHRRENHWRKPKALFAFSKVRGEVLVPRDTVLVPFVTTPRAEAAARAP